MPIKFNFGAKYSIPRVLRTKYTFASIQAEYVLLLGGKEKITVNVEKQVTAAWKHLEEKCAKSQACNEYFKGLPGGKDLQEWMTGTDFTIHLITPKTNARTGKTYTEEDLPEANSAGNDIGISLFAFADMKGKTEAFAAMLLHEIAHTAGASSDAEDKKHALDAENALIPCGLRQHWHEEAKG